MFDFTKPVRLEDLREYSIVLVDLSQGYFGRITDQSDGEVGLDDASALVGGYQLSQGGIGRQIALMPIECLCDVRRVRVRYASIMDLAGLSDGDFAAIAKPLHASYRAVEEMRSQIRTQRSGIVLGANGLLPPKLRGL